MLYRRNIDTPYGAMQLAIDEAGALAELRLPNRAKGAEALSLPGVAQAGLTVARKQLEEYFAGNRRDFELRLAPHGTPFELRVWERLSRIPYGVTISYGDISTEFGLSNGARAVGRANGANPIAIVIPCHRVIGSDGTLTGYGGGLPLKRALLELEGVLPMSAFGSAIV